MEFQGKPLTFQRLLSFEGINAPAPFLRSEHALTIDRAHVRRSAYLLRRRFRWIALRRAVPAAERVTTFREEKGTGARGAPVPVVGLYVKIKHAQAGSSGSRPNEGHVNSP